MSSRAGQLAVVPPWGTTHEVGPRRLRGPPVRFGIASSPVKDSAGAALVLGSSIALWAGVLLAIW